MDYIQYVGISFTILQKSKNNIKENKHTSFYIESSKNVLSTISTILPCSHTTYRYNNFLSGNK